MKNLIIIALLLLGFVFFFKNLKGNVHYKMHSTKFGTEFDISRLEFFEIPYKKGDTLQLHTGIDVSYFMEKITTSQIMDTSYVWKSDDGHEYKTWFWRVVIDEVIN